MITLPGDIALDGNWDGTSVNNGVRNENLDSAMSSAEHRRIVLAASGLLAGEVKFTDNAPGRALECLRDAFHSDEDGYTLYIYKGIHMPYSDPHITLGLHHKDADGAVEVSKFHLQVSAMPTIINDQDGDPRFHWSGVWFSSKINGVTEQFPRDAQCTCKDQRRRYRRYSISKVGLTQLQADILQEEARKAEQSRVQLEKNAMLAKLKKCEYTLVKSSDVSKLCSGETVSIKTKTGKTLQVKHGLSGNIVNA